MDLLSCRTRLSGAEVTSPMEGVTGMMAWLGHVPGSSRAGLYGPANIAFVSWESYGCNEPKGHRNLHRSPAARIIMGAARNVSFADVEVVVRVLRPRREVKTAARRCRWPGSCLSGEV